MFSDVDFSVDAGALLFLCSISKETERIGAAILGHADNVESLETKTGSTLGIDNFFYYYQKVYHNLRDV